MLWHPSTAPASHPPAPVHYRIQQATPTHRLVFPSLFPPRQPPPTPPSLDCRARRERSFVQYTQAPRQAIEAATGTHTTPAPREHSGMIRMSHTSPRSASWPHPKLCGELALCRWFASQTQLQLVLTLLYVSRFSLSLSPAMQLQAAPPCRQDHRRRGGTAPFNRP